MSAALLAADWRLPRDPGAPRNLYELTPERDATPVDGWRDAPVVSSFDDDGRRPLAASLPPLALTTVEHAAYPDADADHPFWTATRLCDASDCRRSSILLWRDTPAGSGPGRWALRRTPGSDRWLLSWRPADGAPEDQQLAVVATRTRVPAPPLVPSLGVATWLGAAAVAALAGAVVALARRRRGSAAPTSFAACALALEALSLLAWAAMPRSAEVPSHLEATAPPADWRAAPLVDALRGPFTWDAGNTRRAHLGPFDVVWTERGGHSSGMVQANARVCDPIACSETGIPIGPAERGPYECVYGLRRDPHSDTWIVTTTAHGAEARADVAFRRGPPEPAPSALAWLPIANLIVSLAGA